jgi:hypothetical protein
MGEEEDVGGCGQVYRVYRVYRVYKVCKVSGDLSD